MNRLYARLRHMYDQYSNSAIRLHRMLKRDGWLKRGTPKIRKLVYCGFDRFCMNSLRDPTSIHAEDHKAATGVVRKGRKVFG